MKNSLLLLQDRIMLRKRALIETVNYKLKNQCQIEKTRHRSFENFFTNLFSGFIAYSFLNKKAFLNIEIIKNGINSYIELEFHNLINSIDE